MAQLIKHKKGNPFSGGREIIEVEYDFAQDGGSVGALDVMTAQADMVVHNIIAKVKTLCTSGGSATVSLGKSGDAAGLMGSTAVASLTAGAVIDQASIGSGYKLAEDEVVQMEIGTAALTAGKIVFVMEVSKF
jgi:hypothetical protein